MSSFMLLYRDDAGIVSEIPLVYRSGELSEVGGWMSTLITGETFWKVVAQDRAGIICENRERMADMRGIIRQQQRIIEYARDKLGPLQEVSA